MNVRTFKNLFKNLIEKYDFSEAYGVWFKESPETLSVVELQKSSYSKLFYINIKINIQGIDGIIYFKDEETAKGLGDIFLRAGKPFSDALDLTTPLDDFHRINKLQQIFDEIIIPLLTEASTKIGLIKLYKSGRISLFPEVRKILNIPD